MRSVVGREVWDSYFKFAVERNPWDRQVSNYFHRQSRHASKQEFERYITSPIYRQLHHVRLNNWGIYTINNEIAVDAMIRYENLARRISRRVAADRPDRAAAPAAAAGRPSSGGRPLPPVSTPTGPSG